MSSTENTTYGLIVDGLNGAEITRKQMERTLAGGVNAIQHTFLRPQTHDFEAAMIELVAKIRVIEEMPEVATIAHSAADIEKARAEGRVAVIIGAQNATLVESDLALLSILHRVGFRVLQPTYNEHNLIGDGALVAKDAGLSDFGRQWVREMNRVKMVIDLSHCGYQTGVDIIEASEAPVVFTHANAKALCDSPRNKPDEQIRAVAEKGGVVGAVIWAVILRHERQPTIDDYLDQVAHIVNVAGIDHVSFATDLTEGTTYTSSEEWESLFGRNGKYSDLTRHLGEWYTFHRRFTAGYESLAYTPRIWDGLVNRGFGEDDVEKIMGLNILRVFRDIWGE